MVTFEGRISEVMESWPLQLIVTVGTQWHMVTLTDATEVKRDGIVVGPGALRPGQVVAVQAERRPPGGVAAVTITIRQ